MLEDIPFELRREGAVLSTDRSRIDVDTVLAMLRRTHWGGAMDRATLVRAIANSLNVAVYEQARLVAFARAVTDLATYAYLTDVVVDEECRGRHYGTWMVEAFLAHPDLQGLRRFALLTRDAQWLYERFGFSVGVTGTSTGTSIYMERRMSPPPAAT